LTTLDIRNNVKRKQLWLCIYIRKHRYFYVSPSGFNLLHGFPSNFQQLNYDISHKSIFDSPFAVKRAVITKNDYGSNSEAVPKNKRI